MIGRVYTLKGSGKTYVGSTKNSLKYRLYHHLKQSEDITGRRNSVLYQFIREQGCTNFTIELLEEYTHDNPKQLREREQYWIDQLKPELNMFRAIPNPNYEQECRDKEERRQRSNRFYHAHKEECLRKQREYAQLNADAIRERRKEYREKNADAIRERKAEKITCECGAEITKSHKLRHERTKQHAKMLLK